MKCKKCKDTGIQHGPSGIDACKRCAQKAEAEYQGEKGK